MTKNDCIGKYVLRNGDLLPEKITEWYWLHYRMTVEFCQSLKDKGLLFDNKSDAIDASRRAFLAATSLDQDMDTVLKHIKILEY